MNIDLEQIKKQARQWYKDFLVAALSEEPFFPKDIRFGKVKAQDTLRHFAKIIEETEKLIRQSKTATGRGYLLDFEERNDQKIGRQKFIKRIYFENETDYLLFTGKQKEYQQFKRLTRQTREKIPQLIGWIKSHPLKFIDFMLVWEEVMSVAGYFIKHPVPDLYLRELPIPVETKFIENNKSLLKEILEYLIPDKINTDETIFEKRFHLKYNQPLIRVRILDPQTALHYFHGINDISIPCDQFNRIPIPCKKILIIENKTNFSNIFNFLTIPDLPQTIAIFGKGFGVGELKDAGWLNDKQIYYWGDIDIHGLAILSQLRGYFPQTRSVMMDQKTFETFQNFRVDSDTPGYINLVNLNPDEQKLYDSLYRLNKKNRLEQDRIPHAYAVFELNQIINQLPC